MLQLCQFTIKISTYFKKIKENKRNYKKTRSIPVIANHLAEHHSNI